MKSEYEIRAFIETMDAKNEAEYNKLLSELMSFGDYVIPILIKEAKSRYSHINITSIVILPHFGVRAVSYILDEIDGLSRAATDEWQALWDVLEMISHKVDLFSALSELDDHENKFSRATLAMFIESKKDKRGLDILIRFLDDDDLGVQKIAAAGLGKLGDPQALPKLYEWRQLYISSYIPYGDCVSIAEEAIRQITGSYRI